MKTFLITLASLWVFQAVQAQDVQLSQFNSSPLLLNPALTGKLMCGSYRASVNYRDQWNSIPAPYRTYVAGFDFNMLSRELKGNSIGVGILAYNDVSGDGNLTNHTLAISAAYHQKLGKAHTLSTGFQGAYVRKSVDIFSLVFGNQIGPNGIIPGNQPSTIYNGPIDYFDLEAGIHWSAVWEKFGFNVGAAYFHILEPEERFLQTTPSGQSTLAPRLVLHGGFMAALGKHISLRPSVLYMTYAGVYQINGGVLMGFHWDDVAVYGGLRDRLVQSLYSAFGNDAVIPVIGVEYADFLLGFSYDISTSGISQANHGRCGFEFSLTYNRCSDPSNRIINHAFF